MIVKMRKVDILLYHREQEKFLEELRGLGVVHITSEQPVDSPAAQEMGSNVQRAQRVIGALSKLQREKGVTSISVTSTAVPELLSNYESCEAQRDRIDQELATLKKDAAALEPWGSFDPKAIKRLADAGVKFAFYTATQKRFAQIDRTKLRIEVIAERGATVYFVVVYRGDAQEVAGAELVRLPDIGPSEMAAKAAALEGERKEVLARIERMVGSIPSIEKYRNDQLNGLKYEEARLSMTGAADAKILKLSGWVPKPNEAKLVIFLQDYPAYVEFRDPVPEDNVPVKLKNGKFTKLFEPVIGMYSLPSYREMDVTFFIAPFFVVFYGLCLNDVGYGFLITLAATVAMLTLSKKVRPLMLLGLILGLSTMLCGFLGNGFFGASMFGEGSVFGGADPSYAVLGSYKEVVNGVQTSKELYPTMSLAILAGFIQLFLGMGIKTYLQMRDNGFLAGMQPVSSIFMALGIVILGAKNNSFGLGLGFETFAIGNQDSFIAIGPALKAIGELSIGLPVGIGEICLCGGLALLLLFNSLDKAIFWRPLTGLWELFNYSTGLLSNVLSYLRLFALGLAGGLLAAAINQIGFMFITAKDGTVNWMSPGVVVTVIVLLAGHALNFGLSGLGSFIHPLRLMFVEFYGAVGFQGGSKPFMPFSKVEK
jgi:V/A-type H+-transporting ATPase subunit I